MFAIELIGKNVLISVHTANQERRKQPCHQSWKVVKQNL